MQAEPAPDSHGSGHPEAVPHVAAHAGNAPLFDAVVIGAGPGGVSCAVWLARLGFAPVLVDSAARIGGLCLSHTYLDGWNASLPGQTGRQTAANLAVSVAQAGIPVRLSCPVTRVWRQDGVFHVQGPALAQSLRGRHVVLATGVRAQGLAGVDDDAPGVLVGPGIHVAEQDFRGKTVAVLGGGDNAFENALYAMQQGAARVDLYARSVRAQRQFVRQMPPGHVMLGPVSVGQAPLTVNGQGYDLVLVCYGWQPCVPDMDGLALQRDTRGFIQTDIATAQTGTPGIYAVGEVAQRQHPCVVTAMADGVVAAKAIQAALERLPD